MLFEKNIDREIASERCLVGPHRDDLELCYQGISARKFGSQGQSKSIAIALRLGLIDIIKEHRGESPVVILDDVDSELDAVRLQKLYNLLLEGSYQVFITGTSENQALSLAQGRCKRFQISAGQIIEKE
jgi:DNA replication and repair protein RecF